MWLRTRMSLQSFYYKYLSTPMSWGLGLVLAAFLVALVVGILIANDSGSSARIERIIDANSMGYFYSTPDHLRWVAEPELVLTRQQRAQTLVDLHNAYGMTFEDFPSISVLEEIAETGRPYVPTARVPFTMGNFWNFMSGIGWLGLYAIFAVSLLIGFSWFSEEDRTMLIDLPWRKPWIWIFVLITLPVGGIIAYPVSGGKAWVRVRRQRAASAREQEQMLQAQARLRQRREAEATALLARVAQPTPVPVAVEVGRSHVDDWLDVLIKQHLRPIGSESEYCEKPNCDQCIRARTRHERWVEERRQQLATDIEIVRACYNRLAAGESIDSASGWRDMGINPRNAIERVEKALGVTFGELLSDSNQQLSREEMVNEYASTIRTTTERIQREGLVELERQVGGYQADLRQYSDAVRERQGRLNRVQAQLRERKAALESATPASEVDFRAQAETLLNLPGVKRLHWDTWNSRRWLTIECRSLVEHDGHLYDFGDSAISIRPDTGEYRVSLSRSGSLRDDGTQPYHGQGPHGGFCFGGREDAIYNFMNAGNWLEAVSLMVESLRSLDGDSNSEVNVPQELRRVVFMANAT